MSGYDYFIGQGWSPIQSAAIMGNLWGESRLDPNAIGDGGAAYGVAQWHPDRQRNFQQQFGIPIQQSTLGQQYQFVNWELNNSEARAGNLLRQQTTLGGATYSFMHTYERPANNSSYGNRLSAAGQFLKDGGKILKTTAINAAKKAAQSGLDILFPGLGTALSGVTGAIGLGGNQGSWFDSFVAWLAQVSFIQRLALGIFALILIIGGIYLLGRDNPVTDAVKSVAK